MKLAVLSDIHSNVFALQAVIDDALQRQADTLINLGDILYGPIEPRATYDLLQEHELLTICGNQDRQIYEATTDDISINPTMQFIVEDLGVEPVEWMRKLSSSARLGTDVYLCHGTPTSDLVYLLEDVRSGFAQLRSTEEIHTLLAGEEAKLVLCGHSHTPRTLMLNNGQLLVNPGSVGLPAYTDEEPVVHTMQNSCPHASYTFLEQQPAGWTVQHIKVAYDYERAAQRAAKRGRQDWVHFLRTGNGLARI